MRLRKWFIELRKKRKGSDDKIEEILLVLMMLDDGYGIKFFVYLGI